MSGRVYGVGTRVAQIMHQLNGLGLEVQQKVQAIQKIRWRLHPSKYYGAVTGPSLGSEHHQGEYGLPISLPVIPNS